MAHYVMVGSSFSPFVFVGAGLAAGILSGLFGIGGGIVLVPILMTLIGMTQLEAQGTSLGALLLPVGILAAYKYHEQGALDIRGALLASLGLAAGAFFGAKLALSLPPDILRKLFGVFLLVVAFKFLFTK